MKDRQGTVCNKSEFTCPVLFWCTEQHKSPGVLLRVHIKHFIYPGSLQAANLPVESRRALQSCNTQQFHLHKFVHKWFISMKNWANIFIISAIRVIVCYCIPAHIALACREWRTSAETHVAWCPDPPAAPGFASAEASTAGLKTKTKEGNKMLSRHKHRGNLNAILNQKKSGSVWGSTERWGSAHK